MSRGIANVSSNQYFVLCDLIQNGGANVPADIKSLACCLIKVFVKRNNWPGIPRCYR